MSMDAARPMPGSLSLVDARIYFQYWLIGRVVSDELRPVSYSSNPQRVITLDTGAKLRDVEAHGQAERGWRVQRGFLTPLSVDDLFDADLASVNARHERETRAALTIWDVQNREGMGVWLEAGVPNLKAAAVLADLIPIRL